MFSPVYVCLFVCVHDILKSCGRIRTKLGGKVGCVARTNCFDCEDLSPNLDTIIISFLK